MLRAYGQSQLDSGRSVDASRTLFRIGSVSKLLTAIAVLQLADSRVLDLQRDIREYAPDFPMRYGATTHQLLTHTAGFDERFASRITMRTIRTMSCSGKTPAALWNSTRGVRRTNESDG